MPEVKFLSLKEYDAICYIFLKGKEKTTTDISFQVSIPLIINRKGAAIPIKEKVSLTKQGSQAASPYSPTLKKWECLHCSQSCIWQDSALPNNRGTAVQLSAFTHSLPGKHTHECWGQLAYCTGFCKGREVLRLFLISLAHLHEHSALPMAHLLETAGAVLCQVILMTCHDSWTIHCRNQLSLASWA